jgi:serine/threonine-protein kinase
MSHKGRKSMSVRGGSPRHLVEASLIDGPPRPRGGFYPGTIVAGRFRIERLVASGAMGDVWEGAHCELQLRVAVKTLRREVMSNREVVARFSREALLLGRIQSEHVARVLDFTVDRRFGPLLVTEFIDGPSLASILHDRRFTVEEAIDLGVDVVSGLGALHRAHVIHRDVKPANILLRTIGDSGRCAVFVDFGVSCLAGHGEGTDDALTEITTADRAVGTFEYMAPEQIRSSRTVTVAADLYAVGAILYRAVAGHHAFGSMHGFELLRHKLSAAAPALVTGRDDRVARTFEELVARALAQSPADRYELADAMLADLLLLRDTARRARRGASAELMDGTPTVVPDDRAVERAVERPLERAPTSATSVGAARPGWRIRKPLETALLAALGGLALGALVGGFGVRCVSSHGPPSASPAAQFELENCSIELAESRSAVTIVCRKPTLAGK